VPPDLRRLLRYAIATCYPKINHRLNDCVSESYIRTLTLLKEFSFDPKLQRDKRMTEFQNDWTFLNHILRFNSNTSAVTVTVPIPRITDLYRLHQGDAELEFELYTCDTCKEFHCLLVNLLVSFRTSIQGLSTSATDKKYEEFKNHLDTAIFTGFALLTMAKGRAFQMHMQTIEGSLMDFKQSIPVPNVVLNEEDSEGEEEEEDSEDLTEELEAIPQRSREPKPLRKIYRDWLQLMVVHFHAADVLFGYINSVLEIFDTISVKILVPPTINRALLNLEEILTDEDIAFPKADINFKSDPNNKDISQFILLATKSLSDAQSLGKTVFLIGKDWESRKDALVIQKLDKVIKVAGERKWESICDVSKNIRDQVKTNPPQVGEVADDILSLHKELCTLRDDLRLPFRFRTKLKGSLHCEACLASMLSPTTRVFTEGDRLYNKIYMELAVDYSLSDFFFVIRSSFLVILGLWTSYRSIKTLLPNMHFVSFPPRVRRNEIHHTRLSSYDFGMHPTNMDSGDYCGFNDCILWNLLESGARSPHENVSVIKESCSFFGFSHFF